MRKVLTSVNAAYTPRGKMGRYYVLEHSSIFTTLKKFLHYEQEMSFVVKIAIKMPLDKC